MQNKSVLYKMLVFFVVLLILVPLFFIIKGAEEDTYISEVAYGVPVIYVRESVQPQKSIDQIVDDGQMLYLLFDDQAGIVQVYDTDGNYQYSISCFSHLNGAFKIAAVENLFYICDKQGSLYLFQEGQFVEFIPYNLAKTIRKNIDFETNSPNFVIHSGSVWKVVGETEICIIDRPVYTAFYQNNFDMLIGIGLILLLGLIRRLRRRENVQK